MDISKINRTIRDLDALSEVKADELKKLIQQYPYFQSAHVLLALKESKENGKISQEQILYTSSKSQLLRWVKYGWRKEKTTKEKITPKHTNGKHQITIDSEGLSSRIKNKVIEEYEEYQENGDQNKSTFVEWLQPSAKVEKEKQEGDELDRLISSATVLPEFQKNMTDMDSFIQQQLIKKNGTSISKKEKTLTEEQIKKIASSSVSKQKKESSETLAELYIKQEKYEKAIDVFKKLSLKYPEKSSYFASRIKDIKSK